MHENTLTLYVNGVAAIIPPTDPDKVNSYLLLTIEGVPHHSEASMPLVAFNEYVGSGMTLFTKGAGMWPNHVPDSESMPLYLHIPGLTDSMTLFCRVLSGTTNAYLPLITLLTEPVDEQLDLAIPNVILGMANSFTRLYLQGAISQYGSINLAIPNTYGVESNSLTLFCAHYGGNPNRTLNMTVLGAYLQSAQMDLVMPFVYGTGRRRLNLYTHGY